MVVYRSCNQFSMVDMKNMSGLSQFRYSVTAGCVIDLLLTITALKLHSDQSAI